MVQKYRNHKKFKFSYDERERIVVTNELQFDRCLYLLTAWCTEILEKVFTFYLIFYSKTSMR